MPLKRITLKGISLKRKIILLSIALSLFICGTVSIGYVRYISQLMQEESVKNSQALSYQISTYYDEQIFSIISSIFTVTSGDSYNQSLSNFLMTDDTYRYALTLTSVNNLISDIKMSNPYIGSAYVYTPKGTFYDMSSVPDEKFNFLKSDLYADYTAAGSPSFYIGHRQTDEIFQERNTVIPFIVKTQIAGYSGNVYLIVNVSSNMMERYINSNAIRSNDIVLVNQKNQLIASNDHNREADLISLLTSDKNRQQWASRHYFISSNRMETNGWNVVVFYSKKPMSDVVRYSVVFVLLMVLAFALIAVVSSFYLSKLIVKPLEELQKSMVRVTKGEFDIRYACTDQNEVGRLAECFNFMVAQIGTLISQLNSTIDQLRLEKENVRQEQTLKRNAELNALQAQINPHFLYNTLNSIIWLAAEKSDDKIVELASELSKFYEYRIHRGKNIIPICDELEQVRSYLAIQKIRYGSNMEAAYFIDETLMQKLTIKMILQPLVENSIFHGIECKDGAKRISVRITKDAEKPYDILFEVEDDGNGIPEESLKEINMRLEACDNVPISGYGIYNVNERVKLYFGSRYGLHYESEYHKWTKAMIRIPQIDRPLGQSQT